MDRLVYVRFSAEEYERLKRLRAEGSFATLSHLARTALNRWAAHRLGNGANGGSVNDKLLELERQIASLSAELANLNRK